MNPLGVIAAITLVVVLGLGLLYAYRSQTPATQTVPIPQAIQDVQSGRVQQIDFEDDRATVTLNDGRREQVVTPNGPGDPLTGAALAYNASNPTRQIALRRQPSSPGAGLLLSILFSLLPLLVLIALVLLAALAFARARRSDAYEQLERIANLRDRGVLTEDEFQREKRRLLK